jgi:hypothetical protein
MSAIPEHSVNVAAQKSAHSCQTKSSPAMQGASFCADPTTCWRCPVRGVRRRCSIHSQDAHAFWVSTFGGIERLRQRGPPIAAAHPAHALSMQGCWQNHVRLGCPLTRLNRTWVSNPRMSAKCQWRSRALATNVSVESYGGRKEAGARRDTSNETLLPPRPQARYINRKDGDSTH